MITSTNRYLVTLLLVLIGSATNSLAADDDVAPVARLTLSPAAEPIPALKYQFPPDYLKQVIGDAAQFYYRAVLMKEAQSKESEKQLADNYDRWFDGALDEKTVKDIKTWVDQHANIISELRRAFVRTECTWDLGVRELNGQDIFALLIPEAQQSRSIARMLSLKARIEIHEHRYDDAFETLRLGYQLAHDCGKQPTLINSLVGTAIVSVMSERLEQLIAAPDSPNMYWAIASLPRPVVDMQQALRQEMAFPVQMFPFLNDPENDNRSEGGWRDLWVKAAQSLLELGDSGFPIRDSGWQLNAGVVALMLKGYPQAKRELIKAGYEPKQVEAMPVGQVVAIQQSRVFQIAYHEMFKWSLLPYSESREYLPKVDEKLRREGYLGGGFGSGKEMIPMVGLLLPAISAAVEAPLRSERHLAILRTIEAIRMYAHANNGRLPKSLESIKQVPVPNDPLDGKPFRYESDGGKATLYLPPPPGRQAEHYGKTYELTVRGEK